MKNDTDGITDFKFPLGFLVSTLGAAESVPKAELLTAVLRHATGDWGDVCEEDRIANDEALRDGHRLLSVYHSKSGIKFWIITEWDRSVTTVLLPHEY